MSCQGSVELVMVPVVVGGEGGHMPFWLRCGAGQ